MNSGDRIYNLRGDRGRRVVPDLTGCSEEFEQQLSRLERLFRDDGTLVQGMLRVLTRRDRLGLFAIREDGPVTFEKVKRALREWYRAHSIMSLFADNGLDTYSISELALDETLATRLAYFNTIYDPLTDDRQGALDDLVLFHEQEQLELMACNLGIELPSMFFVNQEHNYAFDNPEEAAEAAEDGKSPAYSRLVIKTAPSHPAGLTPLHGPEGGFGTQREYLPTHREGDRPRRLVRKARLQIGCTFWLVGTAGRLSQLLTKFAPGYEISYPDINPGRATVMSRFILVSVDHRCRAGASAGAPINYDVIELAPPHRAASISEEELLAAKRGGNQYQAQRMVQEGLQTGRLKKPFYEWYDDETDWDFADSAPDLAQPLMLSKFGHVCQVNKTGLKVLFDGARVGKLGDRFKKVTAQLTGKKKRLAAGGLLQVHEKPAAENSDGEDRAMFNLDRFMTGKPGAVDLSSLAGLAKLLDREVSAAGPASLLSDQSKKRARALLELASQQAMAMAMSDKRGHRREQLPFDEAKLGKDVHPGTGQPIPAETSISRRSAMAAEAMRPRLDTAVDCETSYWCLRCNAEAIHLYWGRHFTEEEVLSGVGRFTSELKGMIKAMPRGQKICHLHADCPENGAPPFNSMTQCPGCNGFFETEPELLTIRCGCPRNCSYPFAQPSSTVAGQAAAALELPTSKPQDVAEVQRKNSELRYQLGRKAGGLNIFDEAGLNTLSLANMKEALNVVRSDPGLLREPFVSDISLRVIEFCIEDKVDTPPYRGAGGFTLWDTQPLGPTRREEELSAFTPQQMKDARSKALKGELAAPPCLLGDIETLEPAIVINYILSCFENAVATCSMIKGRRLDGEAALAARIMRREIKAPENAGKYDQPAIVFRACMAALRDSDVRKSMFLENPSVSLLYFHEREGGHIRQLPCTSCKTYLDAVDLRIQSKQIKAAAEAVADESDIPGFAEAAAKERKKKGQREKQEEKKKLKERELIEKGKQAEKAQQQKEDDQAKQREKKAAEKKRQERQKKQESEGSRRSSGEGTPTVPKPKPASPEKKGPSGGDPKKQPQREAKGGKGKGAKGKDNFAQKTTKRSQGPSVTFDEDPGPDLQVQEEGSDRSATEGDISPTEDLYSDSEPEEFSPTSEGGSLRTRPTTTEQQQQKLTPKTPAESAAVLLPIGAHSGEIESATFEKLIGSCIFSSSGRRCCPLNQTRHGCQDLHCPLDHCIEVDDPQPSSQFWTPEWHLVMLPYGGHKDLEGKVSVEAVESLLSKEQRLAVAKLAEEPRQELLRYRLTRQLGHLCNPTAEPIDMEPVQSGRTMVHTYELWGPQSPFAIGSKAGLRVQRVLRAVIGVPDAVFSGLLFDMGEEILGHDKLCAFVAPASDAQPRASISPLTEDRSPEVLHIQCCIRDYLSLQSAAIEEGSEFARLLEEFSHFQQAGANDDHMRGCDPPTMSNRNEFRITPPKHNQGVLEAQLNLSHGRAGQGGSERFTAERAEVLKHRKFDHRAISSEVCALATLYNDEGSGRHTFKFKLGKGHTLLQLRDKLYRMVKSGKLVLTIHERGSMERRKALARIPSRRKITREKIDASLERLRQAQGVFGKPPKLAIDGDCEKQDDDALVMQLTELAEQSEPPKTSQGQEAAPVSQETYDEWVAEWKKFQAALDTKDARRERKHGLNTKFAKQLKKHYLPLLNAEHPDDGGISHKKSLLFVARFCNLWLKKSALEEKNPRRGFEKMVSNFRKVFFKDRANEGPDWEEVLKLVQGSISEGHLATLKEYIQQGADPLYLDIDHGRGRDARPSRAEAEVELKLLNDQITEAAAARALIFDDTEEGVHALLMAAGFHISGLTTAFKTHDDGSLRLDKKLEPLLRVCTNCSDGEDSVNTGLRSSDHTAQKTTSHSVIAQKYLAEERQFPSHPIRTAKNDIVGAFRHVAHVLRRVGLFASRVGRFVIVHLTLIFGSGASPGNFEIFGDVLVQTLLSEDRDEQSDPAGGIAEVPPSPKTRSRRPKRPTPPVGATHPPVNRFVDDTLSIMAMFGRRSDDHLARLRRIITSLLGPGGLNTEKEDEVGKPSAFKHAFGVVIDSVERLFMAPWSKLCKLHHAAEEFLTSTAARLTYSQLTMIRGVTRHTLICAPGLNRLILPRLDAGLSDAGSKHAGRAQGVPDDYQPSFALKGETMEEGDAMLRRALGLVLHLASIERGKLFRCTPETLLPRSIRETWPGREGPEAKISMIMDASKTGLYLIDLSTGRYVQTRLTEAERRLFNSFEDGEHATTINLWELLSELFGVVLLGPEHAGKLVDMVNDNTAAENWTRNNHHACARVDQVLSVLGVYELCYRMTITGSRVKTEENFADTGTRDDLKVQYVEGLAELEKRYGWTATQVTIPHFLRHIGWDSLQRVVPESTWYALSVECLEHSERQHPGLVESQCEVPLPVILQALKAAAGGQALPDVFQADGDYDLTKISPERAQLTSVVHPTQTMMRRKLLRLKNKHGPSAGLQKFNQELGQPASQDPECSMLIELQRQKNIMRSLLFKPSRDATPQPQATPELLASEWQLPEGCRLISDPSLISAFAGISPISESARVINIGHTRVTAECQTPLRTELERKLPAATHLADIAQLRTCLEAKHSQLAQFSPPCPAHADANQYRRGNQDTEFGRYYEDCGPIIEDLGLLIAAIECNPKVLSRTDGQPSPFEVLRASMPSYVLKCYKLDAGKIKSPFTGQTSCLRHIRVWVLAYQRKSFSQIPKFEEETCQPATSFVDRLSASSEETGFVCMPAIDQRNLEFKFGQSKDGAAYVASIFEPGEVGRGHHDFTTEVVDPSLGRCPPFTATGSSVWILRDFNGKADVTRMTLKEGADQYCYGVSRGMPAEWLDDSSYLGQSVLGNMVPMNINDHIYAHMLTAIATPQEDGLTGQEKWSRDLPDLPDQPLSRTSQGRGKRKEPPLTTALKNQINSKVRKFVGSEGGHGKVPSTLKDYCRVVDQWLMVAHQQGWDEFLDHLDLEEGQRRTLFYLGYELTVHAVQARALRGKLSALRWFHVKNLRQSPFGKDRMPAVNEFLANLEKENGPPAQKLPTSILILLIVYEMLDASSFDHKIIGTALVTGFWWLLRSSEYLREDGGIFDPGRAITWDDIQVRAKDRTGHVRILPLHEAPAAYAKGLTLEFTLRLFSSKNSLMTCTRSVAAVEGSEVCPIKAWCSLIEATMARKGELKPSDSPFEKTDGDILTRGEVSDILKEASAAVGIPKARVASHSLRRGGASAYKAAGCTEKALQRFGRWTSDAYEAYVFPHSDILQAAQQKAAKHIPRFELR